MSVLNATLLLENSFGNVYFFCQLQWAKPARYLKTDDNDKTVLF